MAELGVVGRPRVEIEHERPAGLADLVGAVAALERDAHLGLGLVGGPGRLDVVAVLGEAVGLDGGVGQAELVCQHGGEGGAHEGVHDRHPLGHVQLEELVHVVQVDRGVAVGVPAVPQVERATPRPRRTRRASA